MDGKPTQPSGQTKNVPSGQTMNVPSGQTSFGFIIYENLSVEVKDILYRHSFYKPRFSTVPSGQIKHVPSGQTKNVPTGQPKK